MFGRAFQSSMVLKPGRTYLCFRFVQSDGRRSTSHQPEWPNQEINGVLEEGGLISFDGVSNKLQYPTDDKQPECPPPVEKEERQRDDNHRYADAVRKPVQRVLVFGFIVG